MFRTTQNSNFHNFRISQNDSWYLSRGPAPTNGEETILQSYPCRCICSMGILFGEARITGGKNPGVGCAEKVIYLDSLGIKFHLGFFKTQLFQFWSAPRRYQ